MKQFTEIPGCVLWLEIKPGQVVNKGREAGLIGDVFCWEDPNNPDGGIMVAYNRVLTDSERAAVESLLMELTNPPLSELPAG